MKLSTLLVAIAFGLIFFMLGWIGFHEEPLPCSTFENYSARMIPARCIKYFTTP